MYQKRPILTVHTRRLDCLTTLRNAKFEKEIIRRLKPVSIHIILFSRNV